MKTLMTILALVLLTSVGSSIFAADPPVKPVPELTPMMAEIEAALEAARQEIAELQVRSKQAAGKEEAMEIMREVARVKRESRIEMFRIQLRYARAEGRNEAAAQLEEIIIRMTAPRPKGTPVPRPAPQQ